MWQWIVSVVVKWQWPSRIQAYNMIMNSSLQFLVRHQSPYTKHAPPHPSTPLEAPWPLSRLCNPPHRLWEGTRNAPRRRPAAAVLGGAGRAAPAAAAVCSACVVAGCSPPRDVVAPTQIVLVRQWLCNASLLCMLVGYKEYTNGETHTTPLPIW